MKSKNNQISIADGLKLIDSLIETNVLGRSTNQKRLLKFLASNRHQELSETKLAVEVFARPESFDAKSDSLIRTELYRLRKSLKEFNNLYANDLGYRVDLPTRSFQLNFQKITPVKAARKHQHISTPLKRLYKKFGVGVFIVLSIMALAFWLQTTSLSLNAHMGNVISTSKPANLRNTMLPIIKFDTLVDAEFENQLSKKLAQSRNIATKFSHSPYYSITFNDNFDFHVKINLLPLSTMVRVVNTKGILVWEKIYSFDDEEYDIDSLIRQVFADLFNRKDVNLYKMYLDNLDVSQVDRFNYDCLLRINTFAPGAKQDGYLQSPKDRFNCFDFDRLQSEGDNEIAFTSLSKAYLDASLGSLSTDLTPQEAFEQAEHYLKQAEQFGSSSSLYYRQRLALERNRQPRNLNLILKILEEMELRYPTGENNAMSRGIIYGFILGDWDKALEVISILLVGLENKPAPTWYFHLAASLVKGDFKNAAKYADLTGSPKVSSIYALQIVAYCKSGDIANMQRMRPLLKEYSLTDKDVFEQFVTERRFEPILQKQMLSVLREPTCPIFD